MHFYPFKRPVKSHLLALLGAHHILHVSRIRVKLYTRWKRMVLPTARPYYIKNETDPQYSKLSEVPRGPDAGKSTGTYDPSLKSNRDYFIVEMHRTCYTGIK
jgi:hypothetical protein